MTLPFNKPIREWIKEDVQEIVDREVQESETIEFKQGLSEKGGNSNGQSVKRDFNDTARNKIAREIIALANTNGGHVIVGIEEDKQTQRAKSINPIPNCLAIADRLLQSVTEVIEPKILGLTSHYVVTNGDNEGIVVFYVPKSINSPHWNRTTKDCPVRRGSHSTDMVMREIQDMVLNLASNKERIERTINETHRKNLEKREAWETEEKSCVYFGVVAVPLTPIDFPYPHKEKELNFNLVYPKYRNKKGLSSFATMNSTYYGNSTKTILGGYSLYGGSNWGGYHELIVCSDGSVKYALYNSQSKDNGSGNAKLEMETILCGISNVMFYADRIRTLKGNGVNEYAIQVKLMGSGRIGHFSFYSPYQSFPIQSDMDGDWPIYKLAEKEGFGNVVTNICHDIFNFSGKDVNFELEIEWPDVELELA